MTILCVRFHLPPAGEAAALPGLLGLLEDFTPVVEALPPDGALADLRGVERHFGRGVVELASVIRARALAHHGVDCAIGAGPGPMLARVALRDARPGETCAVPEGAVAEFLAGKPVAALPGVGAATARTLREYGLDTLGLVAAAPLSRLQHLVGPGAGRELREKASGIDRGRVVPNAVARSLVTERPFTREEPDSAGHRHVLLSAAEELGARLRALGKVCRALTLTVRYTDCSSTTSGRSLTEPTADPAALTRAAYDMYDALGPRHPRVRALALRAEDLDLAERAAGRPTFDPLAAQGSVRPRRRDPRAVGQLRRQAYGRGDPGDGGPVGRVLDGQRRAGIDDQGVARADPCGAVVERDQQLAGEQVEDLLPADGVRGRLGARRYLAAPGAQLLAAGAGGGVRDESGAVDFVGDGFGRADHGHVGSCG